MRLRGPALVYLVVVVLGGLIVGIPFATRDRPQVTSVPIARPTQTEAAVRVGATPVCVEGAELGPDADVVSVQALNAGPALAMEVTGPRGYRASATVPSGYAAGAVLTVPFRAASRELLGGRVCFRATSGGDVQLLGGTTDRQLGTARTTVGGQPAPVQLALALQDAPPRSLLALVGQLAGRADVLRPLPFRGVVLILLALVALVGVPLLVGATLLRQARADGPIERPRI